MALQPDAKTNIDRSTTAPFLLRLFWRPNRPLEPWEFSVAPPADTTGIADYSSLLSSNIRQQSVQIYTWPNCTLSELTALFTSVLPASVLPSPLVGVRLVFTLIFPDTRAITGEGGRGKWIDKPLGSVVIGGSNGDGDGDVAMEGQIGGVRGNLQGDADKTLADARFVIGDYVACSIYPPGQDGRVVANPHSSSRMPPRDGNFRGGPPPQRENGYGRGGYRGGYSGRGPGSFSAGPPPGDWRRGERPPGGSMSRDYDGEGRIAYRGRGGGRPY